MEDTPIEKSENLELSEKYFKQDSKTNKTLKNIRKSLEYTLRSEYRIENDNITEEILKIHGLNKERFDFLSQTENAINSHIVDSVDANANKDFITIEGIFQEALLPIKKAAGYDMLYRSLKDLYGKVEAKRLSGEMYSMKLALADTVSILKNYCYSLDLSKLITEGRQWGILHSKPCKRISSYIACVNEVVHELSNHLAGAIAIATFFLDMGHLLIYKENIKIEQLKDPITRKYIENEIQQLIHGLCHLSRSGQESAFTNLSLFDRPKLKQLISEENFSWYFQNDLNIDKEKHENYVIEYIMEIQNIFLDIWDKGDPSKGGLQYRYPVTTINITRKKYGDSYVIEDKQFFSDICKREIYRYNLFISEGQKIASCCFSGLTQVRVKENLTDAEAKEASLNYLYNYKKGQTLYVETPQGYMASRVVRILKDNQPLLKIVTEAGREVMCTDEHKLLVLDNKTKLPLLISANALTENDYFIIDNGNQLDKIATIEYTDDAAYFNSYVYCMEVYDEKHVFNLSNGITVENCRLINDVELLELASQVNSFGAGSSVSLGSHRVLTLNFNRLALEVKSVDKFFKNLDMAIEDTAKILKAHKELVKLLEKKSLQPFMTNGWIRMDRMFSTFGMCGFIECIENLKTYKDYNPNEDLMAKMLKIFNDYVNKYSAKYGIIGNIEEIPAENMAPRLAKIDSLLYKNKIKEPLYANQFVPLWRDSTIWEKMEIEGLYVSKLTGGGISHVQIGEKTTAAQNEKIIKAAIKTGLEHFALNMVNSLCENNHNTCGNIDKCSICSSEKIKKYTRVIGFFVCVDNFNEVRKNWEFEKRKFIDIAGIDFKNNDKIPEKKD